MYSPMQNMKKHFDYAIFFFFFTWDLILANLKPTVIGLHRYIGCLDWFSVNCVKCVLLCSSSAKAFGRINLFCFGGPYIAIGEKGGNVGSCPKPKSTFSGRNKKTNHKLSKASYLIKISYAKTEFTEVFLSKRVYFHSS